MRDTNFYIKVDELKFVKKIIGQHGIKIGTILQDKQDSEQYFVLGAYRSKKDILYLVCTNVLGDIGYDETYENELDFFSIETLFDFFDIVGYLNFNETTLKRIPDIYVANFYLLLYYLEEGMKFKSGDLICISEDNLAYELLLSENPYSIIQLELDNLNYSFDDFLEIIKRKIMREKKDCIIDFRLNNNLKSKVVKTFDENELKEIVSMIKVISTKLKLLDK